MSEIYYLCRNAKVDEDPLVLGLLASTPSTSTALVKPGKLDCTVWIVRSREKTFSFRGLIFLALFFFPYHLYLLLSLSADVFLSLFLYISPSFSSPFFLSNIPFFLSQTL